MVHRNLSVDVLIKFGSNLLKVGNSGEGTDSG